MTEVAAPQHQQPPTSEPKPHSYEPAKAQTSKGGEVDEKTKKNAELATKLAQIIEVSLQKIEPILKLLNEEMEKTEKTPKEEFDEDKFIEKVQPLIEQATYILNEANGAIKGADPTGELSRNAQRHAQDHKAAPEEQRLAEALAKLTGDVTNTVERARKKIKCMPKAGPKLGPLLDLLQDPLFQILSGIGILLNGVLTLVGRLLDTIGLGGLVRNLLSALGLEKLLNGLGLKGLFETKK
jgi:hypothetical protein